jgi:recombination protein RecR
VNILERLIGNLSKLPGLGKKSASRIAYYLLRADAEYIQALANGILELKERIRNCPICGTYTETIPCSICTDPQRDRTMLCVVEEPKDVATIETMREYRGLYHVLMGVISPIDGVGPDNLRIRELFQRVREGGIREVIVATNPTVEGETTAQYLIQKLKHPSIRVTRLALGLPVGGDLEYADSLTLARAFQGRNTA